jgi:hypothetical protein
MSKILKISSSLLLIALMISAFLDVPVQAAITFTVAPTSGQVGDNITLTFNGNPVITLPPVINVVGGTWAAVFSIPTGATAGAKNIVATGAPSGDTQTVVFTVTTTNIALNPTIGKVGDSVTLTGSAFTAGESVTIKYDPIDTPIVPTFTLGSAATSFTRSFTVPPSVSGNHTVTATGSSSGSSSAIFNVTPKLSANKASGTAGTSVTVTGSGFAASEAGVTLTLAGSTVSSSITANAVGNWSSTFDIPEIPGGSYALEAHGNSTLASSVTGANLQVTPYITINPSNAPEGSTVTVSGYGFKAKETNIIVSWDATDVTKAVQADANGSWSASFAVPTSSGGSHDIFARGQSTTKASVPKVTFGVGAGITLNKASGPVATVITVGGSGFAARESGLNLIVDGVKTPLNIAANDAGAWTTNFTIPVMTGGVHKIDAEGKTTTATSISEATFTVVPEILMDKTEGIAGSAVSLTATGFAAGENGITITYDNKVLGTKITADTRGTWKTNLTIPPSSGGTHNIQVNSSVTDASSAGSLSFQVNASGTISPSEGFIGSKVAVSGTGFAANSSLRFMFDGLDFNVGLVNTDNAGNFNKTIIIPKTTGGSHIIRVQDSQSNFFEADFSLDSTAPAVPKIINPKDGTKMGFFGDIAPTLEWSKITGGNGITYNLQIATDAEFSNSTIDVSGITTNKYTLKKSDSLPRGQYYWHVQAIDGASNASDWSDPLLLVSGMISPAVFALIMVGIVILLGVGLYFLIRLMRRRMKANQPQYAREIVVPEVISAEYKQIEGDKNALPWRLALPQAPQPARGSRSSFSSEDQARLRVIIDFAKSVPLAEPGANTTWLVQLAENNTGMVASPTLYSQLAKGELQLRYEPAWMNHPTYVDLQTLLEGQPILQDLNTFIDSVNHTAAEAEAALGEIYMEIASEINWDIFPHGGWVYISAVYMDSFNWFQGKYLKEPSERDYSIKPETLASGVNGYGLYAEPGIPLAGLLIQCEEENDAQQLRALHLKLRRNMRNSSRIKSVVSSVIQLEVQRNRLINTFSQFNRLNPA